MTETANLSPIVLPEACIRRAAPCHGWIASKRRGRRKGAVETPGRLKLKACHRPRTDLPSLLRDRSRHLRSLLLQRKFLIYHKARCKTASQQFGNATQGEKQKRQSSPVTRFSAQLWHTLPQSMPQHYAQLPVPMDCMVASHNRSSLTTELEET